MSQSLRIERLNDEAEIVLKPSTLYLVKSPTFGRVKIFVSDSEGEELLESANDEDLYNSYITISDTPPSLPHSRQLWWESDTGVLYVQYQSGQTFHWVEAISNIAVPEFAGNGTANTMSRSDHWHEGIVLTNAEW